MALILVSNDDGVNSPGIEVLREGLKDFGDIYVVAPMEERSGASHSITIGRNLKIKRVGEKVFSVDGTPADSTLIALFGILPRFPDIVVSGINRGFNLGEDVFYSGTVAAAREGVIYGIPALSVSIGDDGETIYWESALHFTRKVLRAILELDTGPALFNLNIPNRTHWEIKGIKLVRLGTRRYADPVEKVSDNIYRIGGKPQWESQPNTDLEAVREGYASLTPLRVNLTDDELLKRLERTFSL